LERDMVQPFIHDQLICVAAPALAISGGDGQFRGEGAQGLYLGDRRVVSTLVVSLDGREPEPISGVLTRPGAARFVGVHRTGDEPTPDPVITVERVRDLRSSGERLTVRNHGGRPLTCGVEIEIAADLASMYEVRQGRRGTFRPPSPLPDGVRFDDAGVTVTVTATPEPEVDEGRLRWRPEIAPGAAFVVDLRFAVDGLATPVVRAGAVPWRRPEVRCGDVRLTELVRQSLDDLEALLVADPADPRDVFLAAGSPWYLTLFGRDSLWAARMMLPLGTGLAAGTLRALARRQGGRTDEGTDEAPGKIPHELRVPGGGLPALSYSTIDATPLFVTLLADAWRWGLPDDEIAALLPAAVRCLEWMRAQAAGDGFLRYVRRGPGGLTNQGWKDSADAIRHRDGGLAQAPIALCEVQAYAHEAAVRGAELLEAFGRTGADAWRAWAAGLRERFRTAFWLDDHVALALDAEGRPVDSIASNMGHVLGTGILDEAEESMVAGHLTAPTLASGWGLRTLSSASPAFNPLSYHNGSVWAHDTAISAWGLFRTGHAGQAVRLLRGLVEAAPHFGHRLPELYGGEQRAAGLPPLPYPAACRPQAWSAASAVVLLSVLDGLEPDVAADEAPFGPVEIRGLVRPR
jgi:glycogen debranching enzyme